MIDVIETMAPYLELEVSKENPFLDESITSYQLVDRKHSMYSDLPYHNQIHCEQVASLALHLFLSEIKNAAVDPFASRLSTQTTLVILAGLLHDAKHSGGQFTDLENIIEAQKETEGLLKGKDPLMFFTETVNRLIEYTQYPHVEIPVNRMGQCLTDADILLTSMLKKSTETLVDGLLKELNLTRDEESKITQQEFYEQQLEFHKTLGSNLHTASARKLYLKYQTISLDQIGFIFHWAPGVINE